MLIIKTTHPDGKSGTEGHENYFGEAERVAQYYSAKKLYGNAHFFHPRTDKTYFYVNGKRVA